MYVSQCICFSHFSLNASEYSPQMWMMQHMYSWIRICLIDINHWCFISSINWALAYRGVEGGGGLPQIKLYGLLYFHFFFFATQNKKAHYRPLPSGYQENSQWVPAFQKCFHSYLCSSLDLPRKGRTRKDACWRSSLAGIDPGQIFQDREMLPGHGEGCRCTGWPWPPLGQLYHLKYKKLRNCYGS